MDRERVEGTVVKTQDERTVRGEVRVEMQTGEQNLALLLL